MRKLIIFLRKKKELIITKHMNIGIGGCFGLGITYIPGWNVSITFLFIMINIF